MNKHSAEFEAGAQLIADIDTDAAAAEPNTRSERRELQVQRILQAATECFVRSGFHGASMQRICAAAEMSPGALYRYFPSKEAIVEAIVEAARQRDVALLADLKTRSDVVEGLVEGFFNHRREIDRSGLRPLFLEVRAEATRNEAVRTCCSESLRQIADIFRDYLSEAERDGRIAPIVPLDELIQIMLAIGEGLIMADLPESGVGEKAIETALRASITAAIRPVSVPRKESL